jgi:hypothetical protein
MMTVRLFCQRTTYSCVILGSLSGYSLPLLATLRCYLISTACSSFFGIPVIRSAW